MNRQVNELRQLERTMFRAWPSFEAADYDGWVLRFADGYTKRANSINPHFGSSLPLAVKIAHCQTLYQERGLPTIFRLTPFSQPAELDGTLVELGYDILDQSLVMTCSLDDIPDLGTGFSQHMSGDEWFDAFDRLCGLAASERIPHRRIIELSVGECCFTTITKDGEPSACGLGVLVDDAVGLFDLFTAKSHRCKGFGASIAGSILQWAHRCGARTGFLQVHSQNLPARRLYERFGFEVAYRYWYRLVPHQDVI